MKLKSNKISIFNAKFLLKKKLTQVYGESAPLRGRCVEVAVLHVEVAGAHCLRPKSVEEGHFSATRYAHCKKTMPN